MAFLLVIIAVLAVPVTLKFRISWQQELQGEIKLLWLFGLIRLRLPSPKPKSPTAQGEQRRKKIAGFGRSSHKKYNIFALIRQKSFRRRISRFIKDIWHAIHKSHVCLHIRIGLGDPADTGQLWAIVGPVAGILSNAKQASIEIIPEFFDPTFEIDSSGNIRLVPLQIIYLTVGLLLSPPVWQGIKQMRVVDQ